MKALIEMIAKSLVDSPELVVVNETDAERTVVIELRVASPDLGKVIGRGGKTASAMRTILNAAGTRVGKRYVLEILE
ncbi:MAG: KH domain-containing protein [Leptospirales bacterium]